MTDELNHSNDNDVYQLNSTISTSPCHNDLRRKVEHFKSKLDEISRLYQVKRTNGNDKRTNGNDKRTNGNDRGEASGSSSSASPENDDNLWIDSSGNKLRTTHHIHQASSLPIFYTKRPSCFKEESDGNETLIPHNDKKKIRWIDSLDNCTLDENNNTVSNNTIDIKGSDSIYNTSTIDIKGSDSICNTSSNYNGIRKHSISAESRIPRIEKQSPKKNIHRRSISQETFEMYNKGLVNSAIPINNKVVNHSSKINDQQRSASLSLHGQLEQTPLRHLPRTISNEETISHNKIKFLEKQNEELLMKCKNYSMENKKLKEISNYWKNQKGNDSEILEQCEKLKKEKSKVEEELFKSQQMLNDSFRLRRDIEECLWKMQKEQNGKDTKLGVLKNENELVKTELESMKKFCMENDEKIRNYQLLEMKLKGCLHQAVTQITELQLTSKEKNMNDEYAMNNLIDDYEKLFKEHETTKILYGDSLRKVEELMTEIKNLRQQLSLADTNIGSPGNRRRWFQNKLSEGEFRPSNNATEDEASEYDSTSTISSRSTQRSRIPRRSQSVNRKHRTQDLASRNRTYSVCSTSDTESIASSIMSSYSDRKELDTVIQSTPTKQKINSLKKTNKKDINDTDDDKLEKDQRNLSWYVNVDKKNSNTKQQQAKNSQPAASSKHYFNEIVHPTITTDEVLKAVASTQNLNQLTPVKRRPANQTSEELVNQSQPLERKLADLTTEKKMLEANLSRIPSRGSSRLSNSGNNSRYWNAQEQKYETRYEEVIKEIGSVRMSLKKLNNL